MKILVIQIRRIGDVLLTTPAVKTLKRAHPGAKLDFLAEPPCDQVLERNPDIDEVLAYDASSPLKWILKIRSRKYDWVVDFLGNPRSAAITALSKAPVKAGPGYTSMRWAYNVKFPEDAKGTYTAFKKINRLKVLGINTERYYYPCYTLPGWAEDYRAKRFNDMGCKNADLVIGFAPDSRRPARRWLPEYYSKLGKMAQQALNAKILVIWGPGEKELAKRIAEEISGDARITPETKSLAELAALLKGMDILVGNCNGPKHLATALGVPTLGIYGMSNPKSWTPPDDPRHQAISAGELDCIGCELTKCPRGLECMKLLAPERVFAKLREMVKNRD